MLASILTNLIYNLNKDVEIYLSQIVKGKIGAFLNCIPVKFTSYTLEEVAYTFSKVCGILDKRAEMFSSNGIKNITQWNKHFPRRKMKCYGVMY